MISNLVSCLCSTATHTPVPLPALYSAPIYHMASLALHARYQLLRAHALTSQVCTAVSSKVFAAVLVYTSDFSANVDQRLCTCGSCVNARCRSVPANSADQILCMQLAQNAVHAAMAGYTAFTTGMVNGRVRAHN
jgi:hypothetical protein